MAADLTFDILALDKATSTFVKMSRQVERLGERLDRLDRKDVNVDVNVDTKSARRAAGALTGTLSSGASAVSKNWVIAGSVITGVMLALPLTGALAATGIVAAFGTGLTAIPAIFAAQNEEVRQLWSFTIDHIKKKTREMSEPFEPVLASIASMVLQAFEDVAPTLEKVFADLAPHVEDFARHAIDALKELEPALEPMTQAFTDLLDALGPKLPGLVEGLADAFADLAETISEDPELFASMITGVLRLAEVGVRLVDILADIYDGISDLLGTDNPFAILFGGASAAFLAVAGVTQGVEALGQVLDEPMSLTVDTTEVSEAVTVSLGWGDTWHGSTFTALLNATTGGVFTAVGASMGLGDNWASRVFTAAFRASTGGVFAALSIAMGRGRSWAKRVFRASFRATVAGVFSALAAAASAGRSWASRVFTATFNVRRVITSAVVPFLGRQHGGPVRAGQPVVVGERRPELFVPNTSGRIVPRVPTARPVTGGGGASMGDQPIHLTVMIGAEKVGEAVMPGLRKAVRTRGGNVQVVLGGRA